MDCETYRVAITADPSGRFDGGSAHAAGCPECREFRAEVRAFDEVLARALAIETPELKLPALPPLAARSSPLNVRAIAHRRLLTLPAWIAVAAAVGVAAMVAWSSLATDQSYPPIAGQVLAHMDHEESSRRVTTVAVSDTALDRVLAQRVSAFDAGSGIVSYASACVINGNVTPHLVVQGRSGPITLILMPEERVDTSIALDGEHVHGVILPVGNGSVAVIGQREEQQPEVQAVGERVIETVQWTI